MPAKHRHHTKGSGSRHSLWERFNRGLNHPAAKWVIITLVFILGLALTSLVKPDAARPDDDDSQMHLIPALATFCLVTASGALLFFAFKQPRRKR